MSYHELMIDKTLLTIHFRNNEVFFHQNGEKVSVLNGNLKHVSTEMSVGQDEFGKYVQIDQKWSFENQIFSTSVQSYENMAIFTQHYPAGLQNVSLGNDFIRKFCVKSFSLPMQSYDNIII